MVAADGEVHHRQHGSRLARSDRDGGDAPFQGGHLAFEGIDGRIGEPGVEEAFAFQVEKVRDALGVVILVGRALVERQHARIAVAGFIAALYGLGFDLPVFVHDAVISI